MNAELRYLPEAPAPESAQYCPLLRISCLRSSSALIS